LSDSVIEFTQVSFAYNDEPVLEDVSFSVERGDFVGIVGPNGGGKTTLLKLALGLLQPQRGTVKVLGKSPLSSRTHIGYVPQFMEIDREFPISVMDVVLMGRLTSHRLLGRYSAEDRAAAISAMQAVEIEDLKDRTIGQLSGGQRQRAFIARALASQPDILFLDEPTASVDSRVERDIYELLKDLNQKLTIVLVTHDLGFISSYVNKVACVNRRLICHPTQAITHEALLEIYKSPVNMIMHGQEL
jgi:zinc transport system ATP-binding protein